MRRAPRKELGHRCRNPPGPLLHGSQPGHAAQGMGLGMMRFPSPGFTPGSSGPDLGIRPSCPEPPRHPGYREGPQILTMCRPECGPSLQAGTPTCNAFRNAIPSGTQCLQGPPTRVRSCSSDCRKPACNVREVGSPPLTSQKLVECGHLAIPP
ncbi:hypothetical protein EAI_08607 [Harpegnathos saltator]|uniref:Uncharacterized protein n=1 Tax=Harpegnathos saltator TaxID=610380 RepID=E2C849_HARSA|nr:hypothetical protein EAI_08607 [Harpegnathos saltator]